MNDPSIQIYAIDTHWSTPNVSMRTFDASFNVPGLPPLARRKLISLFLLLISKISNYVWVGGG
jgi:hypothetical protein